MPRDKKLSHQRVLKDGIVAESGSPDYLREIGGIYSHMIQLQNVSENWKMT